MAGLVCHMRDIHCLSCLMPVGSYTEEACLNKEKADPRGSYTPREPGDAGAGGYTQQGTSAPEEVMDSREARV